MAMQFLEESATISTTEFSLPNDSTTLTPQTTIGIVQAFIDVANMAAGDEYTIRIYEKARTADTQRLVASWTLEGAQSLPLWTAPALMMARGWDITMQKVAGTDRSFSWSIRRLPDS